MQYSKRISPIYICMPIEIYKLLVILLFVVGKIYCDLKDLFYPHLESLASSIILKKSIILHKLVDVISFTPRRCLPSNALYIY